MPDTHAPPALTALLFGLDGCLVDADARLNLGARPVLEQLRRQQVPCAWSDQLPAERAQQLAAALPQDLAGSNYALGCAPWPAPDACWQALIQLKAGQLDGCVLVSADPAQLSSGLKAGLWTIGLASRLALNDLSTAQWAALTPHEQDLRRSKATLQLFGLGVHSVIDHLEALGSCLEDLQTRRQKGEKP